jgi:DNA repair exonuclease SbcCD ATPase subunit
MRIHFKKVRYKNLLSTGNVFTHIDLDRRNSTLISGANGSGKSTILDAIVFGLYGKAFRKVNKAQLINSINDKDMLVEVEFNATGAEYLIRRGMKPGIFEIFKNGKLIDQDAASRDYQSYLEQNILGINYKSFNQIVVLGSATYVPFMELSPSQRRDIIEDLLDIQVFSTMNVLAKDRISQNKLDISENAYQLDLTENKITSAKEHNKSIQKIRKTEVEKIRSKMRSHLDHIKDCDVKIDGFEQVFNGYASQIEDKKNAKSKFDKARNIRRDLEKVSLNFTRDLSFYHENDNCPVCKQGIDHDFKVDVIQEKNKKRDEIQQALIDIDVKIRQFEDRLEEILAIENLIKSNNVEIMECRSEIKIGKNALASYKKDLDSAEKEMKEVDSNSIIELKDHLSSIQCEHNSLLEAKNTLGVVSTILKDGGIKARIISQYIPVMNKLINKYLAEFDLFVDFQLDENFNEIIKSRFRDKFSYASFSEGEKLRITLAIMLSWRSVAKLRNSVSTNLLILDETLDGALDGVGIENLIETLHSVNSDDNIFVISHRGDQFAEKFAAHIKFQKIKNFSDVVL